MPLAIEGDFGSLVEASRKSLANLRQKIETLLLPASRYRRTVLDPSEIIAWLCKEEDFKRRRDIAVLLPDDPQRHRVVIVPIPARCRDVPDIRIGRCQEPTGERDESLRGVVGPRRAVLGPIQQHFIPDFIWTDSRDFLRVVIH